MSISYSYGSTSLAEQAASAQDLLALQRGHWQVESANHYRRDVSLGEDSSRIRTGHGPSNAAALNNLALALLWAAAARRHGAECANVLRGQP